MRDIAALAMLEVLILCDGLVALILSDLLLCDEIFVRVWHAIVCINCLGWIIMIRATPLMVWRL